MEKNTYLSFVVPVFNEESNIIRLHDEILTAGKSIKETFEIVFVNDGSTDTTEKELKALPDVKLLSFRRNFGQTAALDAGIKAAQGRYVATLDGDLQNDPADVKRMLAYLKENDLDVVCGWRAKRKDSFSKRFISTGARWLRSFLISDGIHDSGCTLRVYKKECFDDLDLRGEMHRFIPALLKWRGFKVGEVKVNHRPRIFGKSKYNLNRTVKSFLDMLGLWFFRKYAARPLHFLGLMGAVSFSAGFVLATYLAVARVLFSVSLSNSIWPLAAVFLMLFGIQMFVSGLIMDLVITTSKTKYYVIKKESE